MLVPLEARQETGFLNRTMRVRGVTYKYQVYVPAEWNKSRQWPVILFLHGAGERGDDGLAPTQVGIGGAIRFHSERVLDIMQAELVMAMRQSCVNALGKFHPGFVRRRM